MQGAKACVWLAKKKPLPHLLWRRWPLPLLLPKVILHWGSGVDRVYRVNKRHEAFSETVDIVLALCVTRQHVQPKIKAGAPCVTKISPRLQSVQQLRLKHLLNLFQSALNTDQILLQLRRNICQSCRQPHDQVLVPHRLALLTSAQ